MIVWFIWGFVPHCTNSLPMAFVLEEVSGAREGEEEGRGVMVDAKLRHEW